MFYIACKRFFFAVALSFTVFSIHPAAAADFVGANLGAIPDNDPAGRDVTFLVGGLTAPLADVRVSMALTHTYVRDLQVELRSPAGVARRIVFSRTGFGIVGGNSDLGGTYAFDDRASSDWWSATAEANGGIIPPDRYRASTAGSVANKTGGCDTLLTFAFNQLSTAQINGTWTLHIADLQGGDTGVVSSATLSLIPTNDALFADGFDIPLHGSCVRAQFDYTGSNRSSYVVVRNTGGGPTGAITWFIRDNDGTTTGAERSVVLGIASDAFVGGDFDGDGIWDPAVWSAGVTGHFKALLSSRPNGPPLEFDFGQTNDDASQSGDYDGDGKSDFAVYRAGATGGDPSFTLIHLSSDGTQRTLQTGANGAFAAGGSDISGDGFADVAMQKNAGGGFAQFDIHSGVDGAILETFQLGTPTSVIVSGNHSGDSRADTTVIRGMGGAILWTTRESGTGTVQPDVSFGLSASDFPLSGDFDGDGFDDYAIWRPSATPGMSIFSIRPSSNTVVPFDVNFGQNGDRPIENGRSH